MQKYSKLMELIDQLKCCGYTCQAGALENNEAFIELEKQMKDIDDHSVPHEDLVSGNVEAGWDLALTLAGDQYRIRHTSWPEGEFAFLREGHLIENASGPMVDGFGTTTFESLSHLCKRTHDGKCEVGWMPTVTEMLSHQWVVLPMVTVGGFPSFTSCTNDASGTVLNPADTVQIGDKVTFVDCDGAHHAAKVDTVWSPTCVNLTCEDGFVAPTSVSAYQPGLTGTYFTRE